MAMKQFTLKEKITLTHDVFELRFESSKKIEMKPWQFITFILPWIWGRAYSILDASGNNFSLIIKKWELDNWGRWWSIKICDTKIGEVLNWVWPSGHFILSEEDNNKLFIGTGTGLVPLYNQIIWALKLWYKNNLTLLFWVRTLKDLFYVEPFKLLKNKYQNFDYHIYLSQEETQEYNKGYVTEFINEWITESFDEFYICGAPNMIDSVTEQLRTKWISGKSIFTERY